ncbi:hypothetical protein NPIL_528601 [Nephila pilipes]|uniref:Uncharacterized protein n=1 Tax=Nephila pilipes TaxID=299642 RepID=A0A8X6NAE5_NEPPI|nr:hypothetical protein NPIL_528601 [Nephila pilipes]
MNIADLLSRGFTTKQMLNSKWWEGAIWLKENPESWRVSEELGGEQSNSNNETDNENNVTSADAAIARKFTSCGRPGKAATRLDLLNNVSYTLEKLSESQG